ncbi:beta-amyrin 28-monooxygenase-like [Rhodamnia argentea]|uniref:Beta-amyrin 28-monooxygenase-like n=1 Tax=Rhodamnia argentea TaxID=178133 RepID=A0ABM3HK80_9MYRT|nr:beta-amyrin 28-monooxygenase-like [Rhodamnia argentea]XP_048137012.1 beta-amyrin 28-monooxygenase-like [Rhodamnia argentea]XP_048137013.1 beta-amyrin 28-monooxygenase-like [Rhodamnia argentea]XP_048137014.1 beta-amyrin 28-monooxygenase-like [Rhodamnia argentea]
MEAWTLVPGLALLLLLLLAVIKLLKPKATHPNLPPGSFGWPVIGESLEFLRCQRGGHPEKFIQDRMSKYNSPVFRTSVLGEPMAVLYGPAGNKFLFSNEGKKVALWWPSSVGKLMGRCLVSKVGDEARSDKKMLMSFFNPEALMRIVGVVDEVTKDHLRIHWEGKDQLEAYSTLKQHTFDLACRLFMSITDPQLVSRLADHFHVFLRGVVDLPLNVPGTNFYRSKKAADSIRKELRVLVKQRRAELEKKTASPSQDIMTHLIANGDENGKLMPEAEIINNMMNLLFAGHDTSSSTLVLIIKYLSELPHVLEKVVAEQREIAASKAGGELIQWGDLQKMRYSWNVISEVMRMTAPVYGSFREALVDFTYEGYTIPKGWKLHWSACTTHGDPDYHPRAPTFDESRFEGSGPAPYSYVPFGGGPRMCLGLEFARVELLVFLHNLVNGFRWSLVNPDEKIIYDPMPIPVGGLPIHLRPRD